MLNYIKNEKGILTIILVVAFLSRIMGIGYGLPLWLIPDEPPYITAALKMIELKTIIPALHTEEFSKILYFPPYLAYIYLLPFGLLLLIKYSIFGGGLTTFIQYNVSDLSSFFIIARIITLAASLFTIFLTYKIGKNIFGNSKIAIFASAFLGFSLLPTGTAFIARDWTFAVFAFTLSLYFLSKPDWTINKRFFVSLVTAGISTGVSILSGFIIPLAILWYIFVEKVSFKTILKNKIVYLSLLSFGALTTVSLLVYPYGFFLKGGANSLDEKKTILGFLKIFYDFFRPVLSYDIVLFIFAMIGLVISFIYFKKYFLLFFIFILIYISPYYFFFHHDDRFMLPLYPLLSLTAGYGLYFLCQKIKSRKFLYFLTIVPFAFMMIMIVKLDSVILKNDTRWQARRFIEENLAPKSKIIVLAPLLRLSNTKEAIMEQKIIDAGSLRQIDYAEENLPDNLRKYPAFHVLNLDNVANKNFYSNMSQYIKEKKYEYLLVSEKNSVRPEAYNVLIAVPNKRIINTFEGSLKNDIDITRPNFNNFMSFLKMKSGGPTLTLYQISNF